MNDKPTVPALHEIEATIRGLIDDVSNLDVTLGRETDSYGKCVEAMWRAGYVAMEAVARELGVTGFQHSVASLQLLCALRGYEGPVMVLEGEKAVYPQYDLVAQVRNWLASDDVRAWLAEKARERIAADDAHEPHLNDAGNDIFAAAKQVRTHWEELAKFAGESEREAGQ